MNQEEQYLKAAIEKVGCVIAVCSYSFVGKSTHQKLLYTSPNLVQYGVNANALMNGLRLLTDYIHPEDRDKFKDALNISFENRKNFAYGLRIVGDDGRIYNVNVDVYFLESTDFFAKVEYIIREESSVSPSIKEIDEKIEEPLNGQDDKTDNSFHITPEFFASSGIDILTKQFASLSGVYSIVVDVNGKKLTEPSGPKSYFGEFYSMVENNKYKEIYEDIKNSLVDSKEAYFSEIDDGNADSRLAAAPIYVCGVYYATWILYAYTELQAQNLYKAYKRQFDIAKGLSQLITKLYKKSGVTENQEKTKNALIYEIQQKETLSHMSEYLMRENESKSFEKAFEEIGKLLDIDYIVHYAMSSDNPEVMEIKDFWCKSGNREEAENVFGWSHDHYNGEMRKQIEDGGISIDRLSMTNRMRVEIFRGNARAVMVYPIRVFGKYQGRLVFIENTKEREWTHSEKKLAEEVARLYSRDLMLRKSFENHNSSRSAKLITYILDSLGTSAFIRSRKTGKIIYMNQFFIDKLGENVVGLDSTRIIPSLDREYEEFLSQEKGEHSQKVIHFQRYIDALSANYDVTQIKMTWKEEESVDLMILSQTSEL